MFFIRFLFLFVVILAAATNSSAAKMISGKVVEVIDGQTFKLEDEKQIRLSGIQAPALALANPQFRPWPFAFEARTFLEDLIKDKEVKVHYDPSNIDRNGRIMAHVYVDNETRTWVQEELLSRGLVRGFRKNFSLVD